ncbi:hypothetical protein ACHAPT_001711 [Fusarium lateritium]
MALERGSETSELKDCVIHDRKHPMYVSFIKINGQHYLQRMWQNYSRATKALSSSASDKSEVVCRLTPSDWINHFFVAVDAAGVRQVFPVAPDQREAFCRNYPTLPGAWWYLQIGPLSFYIDGQFLSDKGRTIAFGPNQLRTSNIKRLVTLPPKPCRVFINQIEWMWNLDNLQYVAFEGGDSHPFPAAQDALPTLPAPRPTLPTESFGKWKYWYTSCSMRGASRIYPCIDGAVNSDSYQAIIGLLVEFANGQRESVGWVRLDWVAEPIALHEGDKLCILGGGAKLFLEVVTFPNREPAKTRQDGRLEVDQSDILEWCFSISPRRNFLFNGHDHLG